MALVGRLLFYHQTLRDLKRVISRERGIASIATCARCFALGHPALALVRSSLGAKHKLDKSDNHALDFNQKLPFSTFWSQNSGLLQFWQEVLAGRI